MRDFNFNDADVLKPNVMGPGFLIWGAWTPIAIDNAAYQGKLYCIVNTSTPLESLNLLSLALNMIACNYFQRLCHLEDTILREMDGWV